jgi:ABC-2 type transport system ATP-binding protein
MDRRIGHPGIDRRTAQRRCLIHGEVLIMTRNPETASMALVLDGVTKSYSTHRAVDALSLRLARGEIYTLLGPNGAGKTTTLNLILGFAAPDAGRIEVAGIAATSDPVGARSRTAYLPETVMLHPSLSAVENLRYFALLAGVRLDVVRSRSLLSEAGLEARSHDLRTSGFSKGMRQKVGVAIALAKQAELLLLDEPTSGLDARASNELSALIRTTAARGIAVLMTTHDLYRVGDVAHRLGILNAGRLVAERDARTIAPRELEALYLEQLAA